ncbi:hypothetical protein IC3_04625 [Bacillus cereus VD142]|nr:hypothetical protein IC3_04625 [Bacillus cereus VD142]
MANTEATIVIVCILVDKVIELPPLSLRLEVGDS